MTNTRYRLAQCMDNGECHLPDLIKKIIKKNLKNIPTLYKTNYNKYIF